MKPGIKISLHGSATWPRLCRINYRNSGVCVCGLISVWEYNRRRTAGCSGRNLLLCVPLPLLHLTIIWIQAGKEHCFVDTSDHYYKVFPIVSALLSKEMIFVNAHKTFPGREFCVSSGSSSVCLAWEQQWGAGRLISRAVLCAEHKQICSF